MIMRHYYMKPGTPLQLIPKISKMSEGKTEPFNPTGSN